MWSLLCALVCPGSVPFSGQHYSPDGCRNPASIETAVLKSADVSSEADGTMRDLHTALSSACYRTNALCNGVDVVRGRAQLVHFCRQLKCLREDTNLSRLKTLIDGSQICGFICSIGTGCVVTNVLLK